MISSTVCTGWLGCMYWSFFSLVTDFARQVSESTTLINALSTILKSLKQLSLDSMPHLNCLNFDSHFILQRST